MGENVGHRSIIQHKGGSIGENVGHMVCDIA